MIKLIKSTFYHEDETKKKLCSFLSSAPQLSMGKECLAFEKKFASFQKRKYAVMVNSGSSANLALLQSLLNLNILKPGDNVGFSALTWATNVMPLLQLNLNPIPIDSEKSHLNISSSTLQEVLKKTTLKALFITNLLGFCGDIGTIRDICEKKGILLIEDNCESLGSSCDSTLLGNFGTASTFSFFVGHHLSTIEGGMVCTDDERLYEMLTMVRAHGWTRNLSQESRARFRQQHKIKEFYDMYSFYVPAYNLRPMEIQGFIGQIQLTYLHEMVKKRQENFKVFQNAAKKNKNCTHLDLTHMDTISNFAYPLIFSSQEAFNKYRDLFRKREIEIRPIVGGSMVEQPFFKEYLKKKKLKYQCPVAKEVHERSFYIPNNPELSDKEREMLCACIQGK